MEGDEHKPPEADEVKADEAQNSADAREAEKPTELVGSAAIRPVFLGNLKGVFEAEQAAEIFTKPIVPPGTEEGKYSPFAVDRVDVKRGYCFVFLKDATSQEDKEQTEAFVAAINGM
eukprot:scaffold1474_cov132-Cylindrotheca_fusiformis.AAC.6